MGSSWGRSRLQADSLHAGNVGAHRTAHTESRVGARRGAVQEQQRQHETRDNLQTYQDRTKL